MASFPTAVKSFTTKVPSQTIASAHVNDIQDEVTAIEDGLLNGTAHFQSSNSTLANLTVSGGSTLATLQVTGNSTINELFVTKEPPFALVTQTAAVQVASATFTAVSFNTQTFLSTSTMHSTAANPTRLMPASSGVYQIQGSVAWTDGTTAGIRLTDILLNSTTIVRRHNQPGARNAGTIMTQAVAATYRLQTTEWVELQVYQDSGSTSSLEAASPQFSMIKVR